jgi:hypothetical protein
VCAFETPYASWREQPFPPGSTWDPLDELHADLALADSWVAETVIPFVEHGVNQPANVDVIGTLRDIRNRANILGELGHGDDKRLAQEYSNYAELLQRVYDGYLEQSG